MKDKKCSKCWNCSFQYNTDDHEYCPNCGQPPKWQEPDLSAQEQIDLINNKKQHTND